MLIVAPPLEIERLGGYIAIGVPAMRRSHGSRVGGRQATHVAHREREKRRRALPTE
jgi:hypothetical protein